MFPSGSARMFSKTEEVVSLISEVISDMPNDLSIRGHTDSTPYTSRKNYTNWELSADRANATRRVLQNSGYPADKVENVIGKSARDPFIKDDPTNAKNRRISIVLLNEEFVPPEGEDEFYEDEDDAREGNITRMAAYSPLMIYLTQVTDHHRVTLYSHNYIDITQKSL